MTHRTPDGLDLLEADHALLRQQFRDYRDLVRRGAPGARRKALAEQICVDLLIHHRLEEELVYPAVREMAHPGEGAADAEPGHAGARQLVAQLLSMDPDEAAFDARVTLLGERMDQHMAAEQTGLFPRARRKLDPVRLAALVQVRKRELQAVADALREELLVSSFA